MKVLVTGGGGFVGAWTVRQLLVRGAHPRVMELGDDKGLLRTVLGRDPADIEWLTGDVSRRADLARAVAGCDRIIHLAGVLGPMCQTDPARAAEINYVGTLQLLATAKERSVPVVYASTALVHASDGEESAAPAGHYGVFKLACELSASVFEKECGLASIGLRPPVVYGFGRTQGNSAGLSLACHAAAMGKTYTIPMSGEIEAIYVEDVASAFVTAALELGHGAHAANLSGVRISITDFIDAIRCVIPDAQIYCSGRQHRIAPVRPGPDIADLFSGIPKTSVLDGVAATIAHHRSGVPKLPASLR